MLNFIDVQGNMEHILTSKICDILLRDWGELSSVIIRLKEMESFSGQTDIRVVDNGVVIHPRRLGYLSYLLSIRTMFFHLLKKKLPLTLCYYTVSVEEILWQFPCNLQ